MTKASTTPPDLIRRTLLFSGRVQGVGFRYTAQIAAARFDVTGYVRNLPDGRVELVAEGASGEMDRLQAAVEQAMSSNIRRVEAADSPASGEFAAFRIVL